MSEPSKRGLEPSFTVAVPRGEDRERRICDHCGFVDYANPKIVAGALVAFSEHGPPHGEGCVPIEQVSILLCRRAIHPRKGYWTMPAGFMELGESTLEAAIRETREEACAEIDCDALLAVFDVVHRGQVHVFRRATLVGGFAAGPESLEVKLFPWGEIPWDSLAFTTVHWSLRAWAESREQTVFAPYGNFE